MLSYVGEEDLVAYYYLRFDEAAYRHVIDVDDPTCDFLHVGEGLWQDFASSPVYRRKKELDRPS